MNTQNKNSVTGFLQNLLSGFSQTFQAIRTAAAQIAGSVQEVIKIVKLLWETNKQIVDAGWVPSLHLPYAELSGKIHNSNFSIDGYLTTYFSNHFADIAEKMRHRIDEYALDQHNSDLMRQAIAAHQAGLFHCVPPTIFAEVERLLRKVLKVEGELRTSKIKQVFREMKHVNLIALSHFGPIMLTDVISDKVYKGTNKMNATERQFINRHSVVHGLSTGSGLKESMNALLLADSVVPYLKFRELYPDFATNIAKANARNRPASIQLTN